MSPPCQQALEKPSSIPKVSAQTHTDQFVMPNLSLINLGWSKPPKTPSFSYPSKGAESQTKHQLLQEVANRGLTSSFSIYFTICTETQRSHLSGTESQILAQQWETHRASWCVCCVRRRSHPGIVFPLRPGHMTSTQKKSLVHF